MVYHIDVLFFINILLGKLLLCVENCFVVVGRRGRGKTIPLDAQCIHGYVFVFWPKLFRCGVWL